LSGPGTGAPGWVTPAIDELHAMNETQMDFSLESFFVPNARVIAFAIRDRAEKQGS
jgi:hypothetical protein